MFWNGRVYFLSDRDGVMNVWSMDLTATTSNRKAIRKSSTLSRPRSIRATSSTPAAPISWSLDLATGREAVIPITLVSDFDQLREHWVKNPSTTSPTSHLSPDGSRVVFTARGEVFTLPAKTGRIISVASDSAVRFRSARFLPDGKSIVALSTETGETEFWKFPANGEGKPEQWTPDAKVLRWDGIPSPDGHWLAHHDKDQQLWIYDTQTKANKLIASSMNGGFERPELVAGQPLAGLRRGRR